MSTPVKIVVGSKASFSLFLRDEDDNPISLSAYTSGKLRFRNCAGDVTEVTLTIPGSTPDAGKIAVVISSTETADADQAWKNADLLLVSTGPETTIIPLPDAFDIASPEVVPEEA